MIFDIPVPNVPIIDERTGKLDAEWYKYLWLLAEALGYDTDGVSAQQILSPPEGNLVTAILLQALAEQSVDTSSQIAGITARLGEINAAFQDAVLLAGTPGGVPQISDDEDDAIYAPLVTGETPGPVLIANPLGECIMAQVET